MPQRALVCRICGNSHLVKVLDLGSQALTGTFPADSSESVTEGRLELLKCHPRADEDVCGLLQLGHSYDLGEMYGDNYGYRSGLNASMVSHLKSKVDSILSIASLENGDLILDIGSNDGTTLGAYPAGRFRLFGIDPTADKFARYYPPHVSYEADFFSHATFDRIFKGVKAKVITSFSMFYDLEDPMQFMDEIKLSLHEEGIWIFEQSYMPTMLERNSYDTVCHEHIEYYSLRQIKWMADRVGFKIIDVSFNDVNGGSFSVTVAKQESSLAESEEVKKILASEQLLGLDTLAPYKAFSDRVMQSRTALRELLANLTGKGMTIYGLGASTKGNVILQYCEITRDDIRAVAEVNPEKYSRLTPGSLIPIEPQSEVLASNVDYFLVLPWHFREFFVGNSLFKGKKLIFPLPQLEIITPQ
jgi:NDP-4-keto-2,6-dideoxyhexose 3-C-methyltransferase